MKISLLSAALIAVFTLSACQNEAEDAYTATPADTAATDDAMAAGDPMATDPMATDPMATDPMATDPMAGGGQDVVAVAMGSPDHTTLVKAVQAAALVETLQGAGPFTVFAPTNAAFEKLPAGTVDKLLQPDMKADLTKVLTYHVVPGDFNAAALVEQIQQGNGEATLTTVQGATLTAKAGGPGGVTVTDAQGNVANVTTADLDASNGVIHVVDTVLMP